MLRLENPIQNYAWGSHSQLSQLLGRPSPSAKPEAELWMGAHPQAPSRVLPGREPLNAVLERDPERMLGASAERRFGTRLPFLLKVLAAETPLSLQAHPTLEQARAGYAAEEAEGVPRDAPQRNYKDASHKPELLCALTPFSALCGFRDIQQTLELFRQLAAPSVSSLLAILEREQSEQGLSRLTQALLEAPSADRVRMASDTLQRSQTLAERSGAFREEFAWAVRIGSLYPGDIGIVNALLLNLVLLEPGQAIYLAAGSLHAYLHGMGVEILANSDNVLRGGLTPKHVDVRELLRVLRFEAGPVAVLSGERLGSAVVYRTPAAEFELQRIELSGDAPSFVRDRGGPEIVFCRAGRVQVGEPETGLLLQQGEAVFIAAAEPSYALHGEGTLFRALVPGQ